MNKITFLKKLPLNGSVELQHENQQQGQKLH